MIDAGQRYEIRAKVFEMKTGMLAPGKDSGDGAFSLEEREVEFQKFNKETKRLLDLFFYVADKVLLEPVRPESIAGWVTLPAYEYSELKRLVEYPPTASVPNSKSK